MATFPSAVGDPTGGPEPLSDSSVEPETRDRLPPLRACFPGRVSFPAPRSLTAEATGRKRLSCPDPLTLAGCAVEIQARCPALPQELSWLLSLSEETHFLCLGLNFSLGSGGFECPSQHLPHEAPWDCSHPGLVSPAAPMPWALPSLPDVIWYLHFS